MSKVAVVRDAKVALARGPTDVSYFRPKNRKRGEGCFICGGSHIWRYCNEKRCPACGRKGHLLKECSSRKLGEPNRRVMRIGRSSAGEEMSVILPIKLNGESLSALLDSGAGPSVIDLHHCVPWD